MPHRAKQEEREREKLPNRRNWRRRRNTEAGVAAHASCPVPCTLPCDVFINRLRGGSSPHRVVHTYEKDGLVVVEAAMEGEGEWNSSSSDSSVSRAGWRQRGVVGEAGNPAVVAHMRSAYGHWVKVSSELTIDLTSSLASLSLSLFRSLARSLSLFRSLALSLARSLALLKTIDTRRIVETRFVGENETPIRLVAAERKRGRDVVDRVLYIQGFRDVSLGIVFVVFVARGEECYCTYGWGGGKRVTRLGSF